MRAKSMETVSEASKILETSEELSVPVSVSEKHEKLKRVDCSSSTVNIKGESEALHSTSMERLENNLAWTQQEDLASSDPSFSKTPSVASVGEIINSPKTLDSFSSTMCTNVIPDSVKSNLKRKCFTSTEGDKAVVVKKTKKKISFSAVTAYYFPRAQGFTCVPSQGGSTLGMALNHSHVENLSLVEHAAQQRRNHRRLLHQLKKNKRNRNAITNSTSSTDCSTNEAGGSETKQSDERKDSDSEDGDEQWSSDISDSELDIDNYYFLQPVSTRQRRTLLREAGVDKIEPVEKDDCKQIRVSRESCGCSCQAYCEPESCSCAQSGIQCQVDRLNFPCGCSRDSCGNPSGRIEFNPARVRTHFIHTLMRLELENDGHPNNDRIGLHQEALTDSDDMVPDGEAHTTLTLPQTATYASPDSIALASAEGQYNWDNSLQLASAAQPQQNPLYSASELNNSLTDENNWSLYRSYPTESASYALYSGASNSTEVFSYSDPSNYNSERRIGNPNEQTGVQQYIQLVDGVRGYNCEYYPEPVPYNGLNHNSFNYNFADNAISINSDINSIDHIYRSGSGENITYVECLESVSPRPISNERAGTTSSLSDNSITVGSSELQHAPQVKSSSSLEENTPDMGSSLATIVKETMVSV